MGFHEAGVEGALVALVEGSDSRVYMTHRLAGENDVPFQCSSFSVHRHTTALKWRMYMYIYIHMYVCMYINSYMYRFSAVIYIYTSIAAVVLGVVVESPVHSDNSYS